MNNRIASIDALINIAGAVPQIHLFDMTDEQWNDGAEMKLHGARRLRFAHGAWKERIMGRNPGNVWQNGF